jgi:transcriptional regulator with XRE-family HTH domain
MMSTKECIKNARFELGLNQNDFAKLMGVSKQAISSYEQGYRQPTAKIVRRLVDKLKEQNINIKCSDLMEK